MNSLSVPRFHIPLVEPDVRISRIRLSDERRLQAHATYYVRATSPGGQACSGIAWSFFGGNRLAPLSNPLFPSQACPKSGPFPPPALHGIIGTTSLSATPYGTDCPSRVSGWWLTTTAGASRVAADLPLYRGLHTKVNAALSYFHPKPDNCFIFRLDNYVINSYL